MRAEIIGVGTELLLGHTINSDAAWLGREMASLGIDVLHSQVVGDNRQRLKDALELALSRSELVITSGGLGPTKDDLTKEVIAEVAHAPLVEDAQSMARLKEYFGDRPMTENQKKQALLPEGATVFPNDAGTAPGCAVPVRNGGFILMFPGPPGELLPMLEKYARPFLIGLLQCSIYSTMIRVFGNGEGYVAQTLGALLDGANPSAATYAADGELYVRVSAKAENEEKARKLAMPHVEAICGKLGDVAYGVDVASLEEVAVHALIARKRCVATAESCTGGLLASRITNVPGSSEVFGTGLVTYANEAKMRLLDVPEETLRKYGAVSPQVAESMATNVRGLAGSDYGIGITGIAGPDGGSPQKPVGLVYICLDDGRNKWIREMRPQGKYLGRQLVRRMAASHALDMLRRGIAGLPVELIWK